MERRILLSVLIQLFMASTAFAQWQVDGVKVGTSAVGASTCADGAGGILVAWKNNSGNIFAQRVDASGSPLWNSSGVLVCGAPGLKSSPHVALDGTGAVFVAWLDGRDPGGLKQVYVQHVDAAGVPSWTTDGIAISPLAATSVSLVPDVISDSFGGAIIAWSDVRAGVGDNNIYAQHLNASGSAVWPADGRPVCTAPGHQTRVNISLGTNNRTLLCWVDERAIGGIYAQALDIIGASRWGLDGTRIGSFNSTLDYAAITSDGAEGAMIAWSTGGEDIYAQRVGTTGNLMWLPNGNPVCTAPDRQSKVSLSPNAGGGVDLIWSDYRNGNPAVYAQRLNNLGQSLWTIDGVSVSTTLAAEGFHAVVTGSTGTFVTWVNTTDYENGLDLDLYAQKLDGAGAPQWNSSGVPFCTATGEQYYLALALDANGGVIATWLDYRGGGQPDLYAERVAGTGEPYAFVVARSNDDNAPGSLRAAIRQANTLPGQQTISFNIPGAFPHTIIPESALPPITDALVIDGFTQPGSSANTNPVALDANAVYQVVIEFPDYTQGSGLVFQAAGEVRGLVLNGGDATIDVRSPNVTVKGCYVGTELFGQLMGVNQQRYGIKITANNCIVGGPSPADRVVIAYCSTEGIRIDGAGSAKVQGTHLGVAANVISGGMPIAIHVLNGASSARIGAGTVTTTPPLQEGNLIRYNNNGVVVEGATSIGNAVIGNTLYNWNTSIDLGNDGPSPNDFEDRDAGPNRMENWPALSSAIGSSISGVMDGVLTTTIYLHFYRSPDCCLNAVDFIGATTVVISPITGGAFTYPIPGPIPPGVTINATATDLSGNTSEISQPITYYNTGGGSNSTANLVDANGAVYGTATFANATATGNTYVAHPYTPPNPISGYAIGNPNDPQIYFNITTDVSYTGGVDVCLNYDENNIPGPEANLVLLHYDGSMWANVTTSRDLVNNKICGHVTSLSPFVIGAVTTTGVDDAPLPASFALYGNVPNPFNPVTTIAYDIPAGGADVNITIYDVAGRLVRELVNEHRAAGVWSVQWNGDDDHGQRVASGVYFYRMRAGDFVETRKMLLLK